MSKEIIYQLAKFVQKTMVPQSYGRKRTKLTSNGFSEIALYSAVARHLEENEIKPINYVKSMLNLIDGCSSDAFYPKHANDYHYLRGQYHDLRNGNLQLHEAKSPEQRGMFLCNKCFLVRNDKERSKAKNYKNTCQPCHALEGVKSTNASKKRKKEASCDVMTDIGLGTSELVNEQDEFEPLVITPDTELEILEAAVAKLPSVSIQKSEIKPVEIAEEIVKEMFTPLVEEKPTPTPKPTKVVKKELLTESLIMPKKESSIKIKEVMADENGASITLECDTDALHIVMKAINDAKQVRA